MDISWVQYFYLPKRLRNESDDDLITRRINKFIQWDREQNIDLIMGFCKELMAETDLTNYGYISRIGEDTTIADRVATVFARQLNEDGQYFDYGYFINWLKDTMKRAGRLAYRQFIEMQYQHARLHPASRQRLRFTNLPIPRWRRNNT